MRRMMGAAMLALVHAGCQDFDVPNLNNASTQDLETNPTPTGVYALAQNLQRDWRSTSQGHAATLSKFGYEHWQARASEPRTLTGVHRDPQTGGFWSYTSVKNIAVLLKAVDVVSGVTDQQRNAVRGWAKTLLAVQLEDMAQAHDSFGIVIDLPVNPLVDVPAIARKADVWGRIFQLLDDAYADLGNAGTSFPFQLHPGFTGFNTPATFRQVNRALKARYQVLQDDWDGALASLAASFLDVSASGVTLAGLRRGPFHVYTTLTNDATNTLSAVDRYSNSRIRTEAQCKAIPASGTCTGDSLATTTNRDNRAFGATAKVRVVSNFSFGTLGQGGISVNLKHTDFLSPSQSATISTTSPLPIIRNEELILLRAEANLGKGLTSQAIQDINRVRTNAGGLPALPDPYVPVAGLNQPATLLDALLYEKRFSLWGEIGTVWLDMHHYNRMRQIPRYDALFRIFDVFPIPESECLQRGFDTKGCFQGGYVGIASDVL